MLDLSRVLNRIISPQFGGMTTDEMKLSLIYANESYISYLQDCS